MNFLTPEFSILISCVLTIISIYSFFNSKSVRQETKIKEIEIRLETLLNEQMQQSKRIDKISEQTEAILVMANKIEVLTNSVEELKRKIDPIK